MSLLNYSTMSQNAAGLDTELRKLRPAELYTLGQILNISDSWKKLMALIPKEGNPDLPKFNTEHFSMIEQAAQQQRRNAAEIFLIEWGTMGKHRPTLSMLLNLLVKAELFRAADYLAEDVLREEVPKRPECGPAAPIDISDKVIRQLVEENTELQDINFNKSLIFGLPSEGNNNQMNPNAIKNEMNNSSLERNMQSTKRISIKKEDNVAYLMNVKNADVKTKNVKIPNVEVSDLMKFSSEHNMDKCKTEDNPCTVNAQNAQNNHLYACVFEKQEMSSSELPIFLNDFKQNPKQTNIQQEVTSGYLPIFLNNSVVESNNISSNNPTNLNINQNEITSFELPQCIAELSMDSPTNRDNTFIMKVEDNVLQNALSSQELPITVLEYNQ